MKKDASFLKAERMQKISKMIAQGIQTGVHIERLKDLIEYNLGLSRNKATDYIKLVVRLHEDWIYRDNVICLGKEES